MVPEASSFSRISCITALGSQGAALIFKVNVGGLEVTSQGLFQINFPIVPTVTRVSGCIDVDNSTVECDTEGGAALTIYGNNFVQSNIAVTIGGESCSSPFVRSVRMITCLSPPGAGGAMRTVVVVSSGQSSIPKPLVQYGL